MPREKESFRDNLQDILSFTDGKRYLNIKTVTDYLGIDRKTAVKHFSFKDGFISAVVLARELS